MNPVALCFLGIAVFLAGIYFQLWRMRMTLDDIVTKVEQESTVEDSIIVLLTNVNQELKDALAANDPAKIQAISDDLDNNINKMATAVTANTPAPAPAPAPGP